MPDQTGHRPLLVLPLPADVALAAAVLLAAGEWWRERHGEGLRITSGPAATGPLTQQEHTPYGRALVLREPAPVTDPGAFNPAPADAVSRMEEV